ncbi:MAG: hypothetical protein J1E64_05750 [Acetatifactor sp.]|nr:hypothetical protein [Acetatifactor sp.]
MLIQKIGELKLWKKRPVIFFTTFFFLLLFLLIIKVASPCQEYHFEGEYRFDQGVSAQNTVIYEGIRLSPGIYQVLMNYETDTDMVALCNVADSSVFTGGLLSNGEHLYSGLGKTGFTMWLYEGTEELQVVVFYSGEGSLITRDLTIVETRGLWTMLLTIVLFLGIVGYMLMIFVYYDKTYTVSQEKKHVIFWIAVISLIASVPYLCGYTIAGADLTYHMQRIEGVKDGLLGGQFPVRLEPRWVYDHGYADAIFYCNSLLYFPALLRLLGFTVTTSYNLYCIVLNIATAWIAYYCFSKIFRKSNIGIVCSALYTLSIIRLFKLVIVGGVGEGSAITFLPLVIYGLYRIFTEEPTEKAYKTAWLPLMIGFAGLIQTHVLTCEVTVFVTIVICLLHIRKVFCKNTFMELLKGALMSASISLWFLVPFLDYYLTQAVRIKFVSARTIQDRGLYLAQLAFHFWRTEAAEVAERNGMQYSQPIGIGLVLVAALLLFLVLWFSGVFRKDDNRWLPFVKRTSLLAVLLLFMSLSIFPWDHIQSLNPVVATLVSSLQFPNRFLGWGTLCLVMIFGYCLWYFEKQEVCLYYTITMIALIGVMTSDMYLLDYVNRDQGYLELYNAEGMGFGYISGAEYLIQGTDESKLTFAGAVAGQGVEFNDYEKNYLQVTFDCVNHTSEESYVDLPLLLYKGYQAIDITTGQLLAVTADDDQNVRVQIPAYYQGSVRVQFVSPFYWRIGELISLLTVAVMILIGWRHRRRIC